MSDQKLPVFDQVMAARFLSQKFGGIHGVQVDQLIIWGYVCFSHIKYGELEVAVDIEGSVVRYSFNTKKKAPKQLRKRLAMVKESIHTLLGPEWDVQVIQNGKTIFNVQHNVAEKMNARRRAGARTNTAEADE